MKGQDTGYDATGSYWIVGLVQVQKGGLWFLRDGQLFKAPSDLFVMVLPPHSVVSVVLKNANTINSAVFSKKAHPKNLPLLPMAFPLKEAVQLTCLQDVERLLSQAQAAVSIQRTSRPHVKSERLMKYLSEHFHENTPLPELSKKFSLAPSVLSRIFRRDWGKPPIHFRNYLRLLESFRLLAEKSAVTDVAYEIGFNDLSRFMKQFKSTLRTTPGSIQKRSKNAKSGL